MDVGKISIGDTLSFQHNLPEGVTYDKDDSVFHAEVTGSANRRKRLKWCFDGKEYSLCRLTDEVCEMKYGGLSEEHHWYSAKMWGTENGSLVDLVDLLKTIE